MLLADVGLLGLPNAGKSTFIRSVSRATPKVADYPFTTLVPNLGVVNPRSGQGFVIADIPGLIEGAADGAGLGIRFLKHLERCRVLLHVIDIAPIDESDPVEAATSILTELEKYSPKLAAKPRWLVINKTDLMLEEELDEQIQRLIDALNWNDKVYKISAYNREGTSELALELLDFIQSLPAEKEEKDPDAEVEFKWDNYHKATQADDLTDDLDDEDWNEDEYDVEVFYER